jgi:hypothetical protein
MDQHNRELVTLFSTRAVDAQEQPALAQALLETRSNLSSTTGYMMKFGDAAQQSLTVYDVLSLPGQSYPVSQSAYDSLPPYIRTTLERDGVVQILTHYDATDGIFTESTLADEPAPGELIARIASLLGHGLSLHEAVDYLAVADREQYTPAQWATIRGVGTEAIRSNVRTAHERLSEQPLKAVTDE